MNIEELAAFRELDCDEVARHKARMMAEQLDVSQNRVSAIEQGDIDRTQVATLRHHVDALGGKLSVQVDFGNENA